jgi:thiamine pyrophosphate-dependent acetolactate synthase large subunit-like protein
MKVHDLIAQSLARNGVETLFSLMSDDIMGITSSIKSGVTDQIEVVEARHEQLAVAMADGYARRGGDIGVAIVGRGPALAQTGTGLTTARVKGSRVLVITAEAKLKQWRDLKGFPQETFLEATAERTVTLRDPTAIVPGMREVIRDLRFGAGPVVIQIPRDVIHTSIEDIEISEELATIQPENIDDGGRVDPNPEKLELAMDMYLDSDATVPPLILAGRGAVEANAKQALIHFAEQTGAVLATTLQARGFFHDHPYSVGLVGTFGTPVANRQFNKSDYVLAVGCSLNDYTTDEGRLFKDDATIIHIDDNRRHIGRYTPVDLAIVGDAQLTVSGLSKLFQDNELSFRDRFWTERLANELEEHPWGRDDASTDVQGIDPRRLIPELDELLPNDRLVVTDGGQFINWVIDGITIRHPDEYIFTVDFGAIGLGLPIAIGAGKDREETTIVFCGDGGFMMSLQAVNTAVRHEIPLIVVVMNDDALGAEYSQLDQRGLYKEGAIVDSPDIASIASGLGARGEKIESIEGLEHLEEHLSKDSLSPIVLECPIDRDLRHRYWQ